MNVNLLLKKKKLFEYIIDDLEISSDDSEKHSVENNSNNKT